MFVGFSGVWFVLMSYINLITIRIPTVKIKLFCNSAAAGVENYLNV